MLENPWSAVGNPTSAIGPLGSSFGPSSLAPIGIHHLLLSNLTSEWNPPSCSLGPQNLCLGQAQNVPQLNLPSV